MTEERMLEYASHGAYTSWRYWMRKLEQNPKDAICKHGEQMHWNAYRELENKLQEIRKSRPE